VSAPATGRPPTRHPVGTVDDSSRTPIPRPEPPDALEARVRRVWRALGAALAVLGAVLGLRVVFVEPLLDLGALAAFVGVAAAAGATRLTVEARDARRREEAENVARILGGFSRAVSPDAIIEAILDELGTGTGADHLVVVRRRPGAPILDATLVPTGPGARAGARRAATVLPAVDLDDVARRDGAVGTSDRVVGTADRATGTAARAAAREPAAAAGDTGDAADAGDAAQLAAERIADRARRAFGLQHVLAAPLLAHGELLGAIVISRRRAGSWPEPTRRLLAAAAREASAALARTVTLRAAEAAATTDVLTGLPNRRYFEEYVTLLGAGRRAEDTVGILMVDVDRFKLLNDRHGHAVGDVVLRAVARTIAATVRDEDVPARFGGEEFIVLLRNPSRAVVFEVAERVRAAVEQLDLRDVGVERVTVSIGATVGGGGADGIADLVETADRALYRAKRFGRNRVEAA